MQTKWYLVEASGTCGSAKIGALFAQKYTLTKSAGGALSGSIYANYMDCGTMQGITNVSSSGVGACGVATLSDGLPSKGVVFVTPTANGAASVVVSSLAAALALVVAFAVL